MGEQNEVEDWVALGERIAVQAVQLDMATHKMLVDLRRFDEACAWHTQGFSSCAHWLSFRVGWDLATSRERCRVAKTLGALPKVDAALASGQLSYSKARAITRVATPKIEETLLAYAEVCSGSQLETICRKYRAVERTAADPSAPLPQDDERFIARSTTSSGMVCVRVMMRPDEAALFSEIVEAAAKACRSEGGAARFNRVDGLMTALQTYARGESPQRSPVEMILTTPAETLRTKASSDGDAAKLSTKMRRIQALANGEGAELSTEMPRTAFSSNDAVAELSAEAPLAPVLSEAERGASIPVAIVAASEIYLDPETARRLACDCGVVEATVAEDGEPLSIGRKSRTLPVSLKRALLLRDRTCRFPGCTHRLFLDGHHIRHWADGGETSLENTLLLCSTHHSYVHERGYRVARNDRGELTFFDPRGNLVRAVAPRPHVTQQAFDVSAGARRAPACGGRLDRGEAVGRLLFQQGGRTIEMPITVGRGPRDEDCQPPDPEYDFKEWGQRPYDVEKWSMEVWRTTGEDPTATVPAPIWPPVSWYLAQGREPPKSMNYRPKNNCARRKYPQALEGTQ